MWHDKLKKLFTKEESLLRYIVNDYDVCTMQCYDIRYVPLTMYLLKIMTYFGPPLRDDIRIGIIYKNN